jgi:hypothetical protein
MHSDPRTLVGLGEMPTGKVADARVQSPEGLDFDVARSEKNILAWMAYLPPDCIQTMIKMGWDCNT